MQETTPDRQAAVSGQPLVGKPDTQGLRAGGGGDIHTPRLVSADGLFGLMVFHNTHQPKPIASPNVNQIVPAK
jgi:hypothetical protein